MLVMIEVSKRRKRRERAKVGFISPHVFIAVLVQSSMDLSKLTIVNLLSPLDMCRTLCDCIHNSRVPSGVLYMSVYKLYHETLAVWQSPWDGIPMSPKPYLRAFSRKIEP